uniref:Uncharacterized protein n=1 Tax=Chenopodium quinoa TaxID=63459 RepID=A0A803MAQ6_CHEQI
MMAKKYVYLNELNSSSKDYTVKVKVIEKARPKTSSKKGTLYQSLMLADDKAVVQHANSEITAAGPTFQSIHTIPRVVESGAKYAGIACDALNTCSKNYPVIGFTALRSSAHKGTNISCEYARIFIVYRARLHTQQLLDRQAKACNVLQEERHWLRISIPQADLNDVITYIGFRSTLKFEAVDDSGAMAFTTFTADTEKLFGKSAEEIHFMKDYEDVQSFGSIYQKLCNNYVLVEVGPTTTLSRNNILQWCLKGIEIEAKKKRQSEVYSNISEMYQSNIDSASGSKAFDQTDNAVTDSELHDTDISNDLPNEHCRKKSCTEEQLDKVDTDVYTSNLYIPDHLTEGEYKNENALPNDSVIRPEKNLGNAIYIKLMEKGDAPIEYDNLITEGDDGSIFEEKTFASDIPAGGSKILPYVDTDLKKIAARVIEKAKELCYSKSV